MSKVIPILAIGLFAIAAAAPAQADIDDYEKPARPGGAEPGAPPPLPEDPLPPGPSEEAPPPRDDDDHRHGDPLDEPDRLSPYRRIPGAGLEGFVWFTKYRGKVERETGGSGTEMHPYQRQFGLDDHAPGFSVRAFGDVHPSWRIAAEYARFFYSGKGVLQQDLRYDGIDFATGTEVETDVEIQMVTVEAEWVYFENHRVRLGMPLGFGWYSQYVGIQDRVTGVRASNRLAGGAPLIGHDIDVAFGAGFGWDLKFRFFAYWYDDIQLAVFDIESRFYFTLADHVRFFAGGRYVTLEHEVSDANEKEASFRVAGALLGLQVSF